MEDKQLIPRTDVKVPQNPLAEMFRLQQEFQARFYSFDEMTEEEVTDYIRLMLTCVNVEAVEALNWRDWKPWKQTKQEFNRYEYLNELVDIQHFLINAALAVDCTDQEFAELFLSKHQENINRQQRGY